MKKIKSLSFISLGVACLLGGVAVAGLTSNKNVVEVNADASTLLSININSYDEPPKLSDNFEFDHAMTYGGSGYTGDNYYTGTEKYWDSLTVTYLNPSQSIVSSISFPTLFYTTSTYSKVTFTMKIEIYKGGVKVDEQDINNFKEYNPTGSYFFYKTTGSNVVDGLESYTQNGGSIAFKFISGQTQSAYGFSGTTAPTVLTVYGYASHDVTLNNGSGTGPTSVKMVDGKPLYSLDSIPTIDNGTFAGYYDAATGGKKYYNADGSAALAEGDETTILYAHWDMNGTAITLDKQGGTGGDDSTLGVKDDVLPDIVVPTKSGYTFNGYFEQEGGQGTQYYGSNGKSSYTWTSEAAAATFYASWTIKPAVQEVINKINAIGEVSYPGSGDKITAARTAYNALDSGDVGGVSNYATLTVAETTYDALKQQGVDNVETLINAIGTVVDTPACANKIVTARTAYNALTNEQKELVAPALVDLLVADEAEYKELHDQNKADTVKSLINEIGEVEYSQTCKGKIDAARTAYNALENAEQKALVTNYQTLLDAEATYTKLKTDHDAADNVMNLVNAIGTVEDTSASKTKIDAARTAYDALTSDQLKLLNPSTLGTLELAEAKYKELHDKNQADAVVALINAIGEVECTDTCKAKIDAAKTAYEALTIDQKELVTNKKTLFDAIERYELLKHQDEVKDNEVKVVGKDGDLIPVNVTLKVEVRTSVQAAEGTTEYQKIQNMLSSNEKISGVYDVKLIRTVDGVETVIQPSDIKEGMIIGVEINLPYGLSVEGLKVLHIHSEDDITFVDDYAIEGNTLSFETDRLSEFAFVVQVENGLPIWAILLIIIGGLLLLCCLCLFLFFIIKPVYYIDYSKKEVRKAIKIKTHYQEVLMINGRLHKVRRNEANVYKSKDEAEQALNK